MNQPLRHFLPAATENRIAYLEKDTYLGFTTTILVGLLHFLQRGWYQKKYKPI